MPWDPQKYNQFKRIRYQPFFDLMHLIVERNLKTCVDIGCGTGEQTNILSENFSSATFLGIDASEEMLAGSKQFESEKLAFRLSSIEAFAASGSRWDLIFSNAALQWADDHSTLFPALISKLNGGGQFAVQMPVQHENLLNKLLMNLAREKPFVDFLQGWKRTSPVLSIDKYAQIMFRGGLEEIQIIQKVYPIIAGDAMQLYDFIAGTALIPYLEKLSATAQVIFREEFKKRISDAFGDFPAIYAFKRLLLYGRKK
ncbi:methyltransferase domain-containing protein [Niabella beijingensis]|uniref:methyltransferase domain-containing protein n=1 Tax=Niabella beijingensis TaxID=2872700 RepID=UPI001CBC9702|nr:methyltransferase domain-containing protein [Niabella beijingensis]MBZ4192075.1 methyltransferase domain-containing protein [Niabella beijingensis]